MFKKVLIANRGEIACRIIRTLKSMGIASVAVYSEADASSLHVTTADEAYLIGPAAVSASYLNVAKILEVAKTCGAEAIHPGYGFLSENVEFAEACEKADIIFIGPAPSHLRDFGLKHTARQLASESKAPLLPGTALLENAKVALQEAQRIGFPVMLKSTAGGGGIGMQVCQHENELENAWVTVSRLSQSNFKHGGLYLEKFVANARHVEVQIFGDGEGNVISLGERDCSAQRRNQKVIEETPAPGLSADVRNKLADAAVSLVKSVKYKSAGTVEFVLDADSKAFYFLEVNTRLQVEHGVTEEVTGFDLVEWMIRLAAGDLAPLDSFAIKFNGHALQARIYAENPRLAFRPSAGILTEVIFPNDVRVDTWVERGLEVTPHYDPLLAKIIVHGKDRDEALAKMQLALEQLQLHGIETNVEFLQAVIAEPAFVQGLTLTRTLSLVQYASKTVDVIQPGAQTSVQDYPGRIGYWDVGIPPSGPMDTLAFRLGNRLLGNAEDAAGLELTVSGPSLRFNYATRITLTGAYMHAELVVDEKNTEISYWTIVNVPAGAVLKMSSIKGAGMRTYLCVQYGFVIPKYMGSRSTFTLGKFGGHAGRILRSGDILHIQDKISLSEAVTQELPIATSSLPTHGLAAELIPVYTKDWEIGVLYGPHGAPDYFTEKDIEQFFAAVWEVHYNSNRTGIRLIGPKPEWARKDGGEAGLHPSNIHDNAYAIGAVDFTGDMPILLGPDGPSLGGFVCPATIVQAELWKMGQLKPGDKIRFHKLTLQQAQALEKRQDKLCKGLKLSPEKKSQEILAEDNAHSPVLYYTPAHDKNFEVRYRRCGDRHLLIEYGAPLLDLNLRFRVHALTEYLRAMHLPGVIDLTPGIRSLQVHCDGRILPLQKILQITIEAEKHLPSIENMELSTRIVHMPLSWDDEAIHEVIQKYIQSVRSEAPWCPSNIEFIRRINGLGDIEAVKKIVFEADYLVMGLGDVYLGAPVATPLDPRHRLVTTKYNPARTWTVENVVGIGGAYLCIYGMEGPGGYQLFGRTAQVWNTYRQTENFRDGKPWLLRFFDQIRFYPVSHAELMDFRTAFARGQANLRIEENVFKLKDYNTFLEKNKSDIDAFRDSQQIAFQEERERWALADSQAETVTDIMPHQAHQEVDSNDIIVEAPLSGNVWKCITQMGLIVKVDEPLIILESMKMEFTVTAPAAGKVKAILCREGTLVHSGQLLILLEAIV